MISENQEPLLIVGTGAMACLFAARLSASAIPVFILGSWKEGLDTLRKNGVVLIRDNDKKQAYPVKVIPETNHQLKIRFAILLVKSWQTRRAAMQLCPYLDKDGLVLTLQNGVGNFETIAEIVGVERVCLGVTTLGATLLGPGRVHPAGEGVIYLSFHSRLESLAEILRSAGFIIENVTDATALLWGKLVINSAINPITALLRVPNGEVLNRKTARALLRAAALESASVAASKGIKLPYPDPVIEAEEVAYRTSGNLSSMLQDVHRGTPTEIDSICGAIVSAGEQTGVPTPINQVFYHLVKALSVEDLT